LDALELVRQRAGQGSFAVDWFARRGIPGLDGDLLDPKAHRIDEDPSRFEPGHDFAHEQGQLLSPAR